MCQFSQRRGAKSASDLPPRAAEIVSSIYIAHTVPEARECFSVSSLPGGGLLSLMSYTHFRPYWSYHIPPNGPAVATCTHLMGNENKLGAENEEGVAPFC